MKSVMSPQLRTVWPSPLGRWRKSTRLIQPRFPTGDKSRPTLALRVALAHNACDSHFEVDIHGTRPPIGHVFRRLPIRPVRCGLCPCVSSRSRKGAGAVAQDFGGGTGSPDIPLG